MIDLRKQPGYDPDDIERYISDGLWTDDVLGDWLRRNAEAFPDRIAAIGEDGVLRWGEAWSGSCRLASSLEEMGSNAAMSSRFQLPNSIDFLIAYFAISLMGGVISTLHTPYRESEIEPLLVHGGARAIICGPIPGVLRCAADDCWRCAIVWTVSRMSSSPTRRRPTVPSVWSI